MNTKTRNPSTRKRPGAKRKFYTSKLTQNNEIQELEMRISIESPKKGSSVLASEIIPKLFSDIPISRKSIQCLNSQGFTRLTDIQVAAIPHALAGRDVLSAAKTGSGKTLAFLIPLIELLFRKKCDITSGLLALIITPTRELSKQIFDVLYPFARAHSFTLGLVYGGADFNIEKKNIGKVNILIATPGRLLQHLEHTPNLDMSLLSLLVLDEADRILDLGFENVISSILEYFPTTRQTLLFSATQTRAVRHIGLLSLSNPEYISVHENDVSATPEKLEQIYIVCEAHEKFDYIYSFIRTHLSDKILIFVSSCKQVRFLYEMFCRIRPGITILSIHGRMSQPHRRAVYCTFLEKTSAILLATDLASRGLDMPNVDWVIQLDCPDCVESYIHRVGRTARYQSSGKALLFLLKSELKMIDRLSAARIPLKCMKSNPSKVQSITFEFASIIASDPTNELKYLAQKAFISYIKSIHSMKDKEVFNVNAIDGKKLAESMGLLSIPVISFHEDGTMKRQKNLPYAIRNLFSKKKEAKEDEVISLLSRTNTTIYSKNHQKLAINEDIENDDLLVIKGNNNTDISQEKKEDKLYTDQDNLPSIQSIPEEGNSNKKRKKYFSKILEELEEEDLIDKRVETQRRKRNKASAKEIKKRKMTNFKL